MVLDISQPDLAMMTLTRSQRDLLTSAISSRTPEEAHENIERLAAAKPHGVAVALLWEMAGKATDESCREEALMRWLQLAEHSDDLAELAMSDGPLAVDALHAFLHTTERKAGEARLVQFATEAASRAVRIEAVDAVNLNPGERDGIDSLIQIVQSADDGEICGRAASRLAEVDPTKAFEILVKLLHPSNLNRRPAAEVLAAGQVKLPQDSTKMLKELWVAQLYYGQEDWELANQISETLKCNGTMLQKLESIDDLLTRDPNYSLSTLNPQAISWSINAGVDDLPAAAKYLIDKGIDASDRQVAVAAFLLRTVAGGPDMAGQLIAQVVTAEDVAEEALRDLRVEIGGKAAMSPILKKLDEQFREEFLEPVRDTLNATEAYWQKMMQAATRAFQVKLIMSVLVFGVGIILTVIAAWQVIFAGQGAALWGPGATLAVGLGAMYSVVYGGPLKKIRESVAELGSANAAFISYVHRVSQISYTFSGDYEKGKVSLRHLKEFGVLLDASAKDVVSILSLTPEQSKPR